MGLDPGTPGSRPGPKASAQRLSPPGAPRVSLSDSVVFYLPRLFPGAAWGVPCARRRCSRPNALLLSVVSSTELASPFGSLRSVQVFSTPRHLSRPRPWNSLWEREGQAEQHPHPKDRVGPAPGSVGGRVCSMTFPSRAVLMTEGRPRSAVSAGPHSHLPPTDVLP